MLGVGWLGSRTGFQCKSHFLQDWLHPSTSDRPQFPGWGGMITPPIFCRPQTLLPKAAKLWGIFSLAHPGERPTLAEAQEPSGKISFAELTKNTNSGHFCFWWCLFFKPTCSLGSAGKQDIPREGRRLREQIPLQLWREAPGPCSGEGGPAASLPAGSGEASSPSVPVSPAEESCPLSDLRPHRPSQRFPNRAPGS